MLEELRPVDCCISAPGAMVHKLRNDRLRFSDRVRLVDIRRIKGTFMIGISA